MGSSDQSKILVVRPDRLGDVILSTPVLGALRDAFPKAEIYVLVRSGVLPLLSGLSSVSGCITYDPEGIHAGLPGVIQLAVQLRKLQFDTAIVLQTEWKIALALVLARVPVRVGPLSKLHSYFFYNRALRQKRSRVEMHEADYNLQLLKPLGLTVPSGSFATQVSLSDSARMEARNWLVAKGWTEKSSWVVVHPGMGGSALNWPETSYVDLIRQLMSQGRKVLITGGPADRDLLGRLRIQLAHSTASSAVFYDSTEGGGRSIDFLGGLFSHCSLVIAPSTGPLHLAIALGVQALSFYPPIQVQSVARWGPYLTQQSSDQAKVWTPEVECGQVFQCKGSLCKYYPCMESLTVEAVVRSVNERLPNTCEKT